MGAINLWTRLVDWSDAWVLLWDRKAAMLIRRVEGCVIVFLYVRMCVYVFPRKKEKTEKRKGAADWLQHVPVAVLVGAAGLFLNLSPIRDHTAYHDGSVYIYQHNTEQKTQTRLCVQQSTPLELKGVWDCEAIICYTFRYKVCLIWDRPAFALGLQSAQKLAFRLWIWLNNPYYLTSYWIEKLKLFFKSEQLL